jgi:hypothetical protein
MLYFNFFPSFVTLILMFVPLLLFLQSTIGEPTRNPLLFPLCSSDSDFASNADNDEITQLSPPLSNDEFLSSYYSNSGASSKGSDSEGSDGSYLASLLQYHKDAFYKVYTPIWEWVQKSTQRAPSNLQVPPAVLHAWKH